MSQHTAIFAIQNLPGFGWIDAFIRWSPLFRLPTLLSLIFLLSASLYYAGADITMLLTLIAFIALLGASLSIFIILAQGAQQDLSMFDGVDCQKTLKSESVTKEVVIAHLNGFLLCCVTNLALSGSLIGWLRFMTPSYLAESGVADTLTVGLTNISMWLMGVILAHQVAFGRRQYLAFCDFSKLTDINLLRIKRYQIFTLQPMRYLLILVTYTSLCILMVEILADPIQYERLVNLILIPMGVLLTMFGYFFLRPVVIIRDRIQLAKTKELANIQSAINGDRSKLVHTQISHIAEEFSAPDLMRYEEKIESLWEWPIQGNLQRLVLYVMLPPIAWVLAALVERLVDQLI